MKRASFLFLSAAVLAGCPTTNEDPDEGIYVGNPGVTALRIGAIDGTDVVDQGFSAEEFTLTSCDGEHTDSVDLSEGLMDGDEFDIPSGPWCSVTATGVTVVIDAEVGDGNGDGDGDDDDDDNFGFLTLWLELDEVELTGATTDGFSVEADGTYVLELAPDGWLDVDDFEDDFEFDELEIVPGDEEHDVLADLLRDQTVLWSDADASGDIDTEERADGSLADTDEPVAPSDGDDDNADSDGVPSCANANSSFAGSSNGFPVALLLMIGFALRRRLRG